MLRIVSNESRLTILDKPFDYHMFKRLSPKAMLRRVEFDDLPEILRKNEERFHYVDFDESEYTSSH